MKIPKKAIKISVKRQLERRIFGEREYTSWLVSIVGLISND